MLPLAKFLQLLFVVIEAKGSFGFQGFQRNVLNLPEVTSQSSSLHGQAWTIDDVTGSPLNAITACMWVKSTNLSRTGTLFSYSTATQRLQFAVVAYERHPVSSLPSEQADSPNVTSEGIYDVYLVIGGKRATEAITLRLDDVIWHYVCVAWNSTGKWKFFMDGRMIKDGKNFQTNVSVEGRGRFYFGSINESYSDAELNFIPFTGKITGFSMWRVALSAADVAAVGDCEYFNTRQRLGWSFRNTNADRNFSSSVIRRLNNALVYDWSTDSMSVTWPAGFYPNENVCGAEVTVDCNHNNMVISVSRQRTSSLFINRSDLHLNDAQCIPTTRGWNGGRYVFQVTDFSSCGTQRLVTDTEVIYVNRVSNTPTQKQVVFISYLYRSEVRCHYPIDLTVSTRLLDSAYRNQMIYRTTMQHPQTKQEDIEALVILFEDEAFSRPYNDTPHLSPLDSLYVGLVVKDKVTQHPINDLNVVVDTCWVTSNRFRRRIIDNNGCWHVSDEVSVLENGKRSQARIKISSRIFSFSSGPVYLQCTVHACLGRSCVPTCDSVDSSQPRTLEEAESAMTSSAETRLSKRAVSDDDSSEDQSHYDITIGPVYVRGFWTHKIVDNPSGDSSNVERSVAELFQASPVFLATVVILSCVAVVCLLLTIVLLRKKRRDASSDSNDVTHPVQIMKHKRRQSSDASLTSLSSIVMTSSMGSLSSIDSLNDLSFSRVV